MSASRVLCAFSAWLSGKLYCAKRGHAITASLCLACRLHRPKIEPPRAADNSKGGAQ
jgi:hypothetical protein